VDQSPQIFGFWTQLINVDTSEILQKPKELLVEQSVIRVSDLELLFKYCQKLYQQQ
jgi:hypothetical protein